jgi:hypothetical protein
MNHLIEVPLWQLLILVVLAFPAAGTLGKYLGYKIGGPVFLYLGMFFIGHKLKSFDKETGAVTYTRIRGFKAIKIYRIIRSLEKGFKK